MKAPANNQQRRRNFLIGLALAAITLAVYWPMKGFEFNDYDDAQYITENAQIHSGLTVKNLEWSFTTGYASNWHPVTWLSHLVDFQLYGLNPAGHHLTNLLFHVVNTLLLFGLLLQLTGRPWRSGLVAALFAWHPMHVESVAWVAERKDVLSGFFGLLTLLAYAKYVKGSKAAYGWALACYALGLMAKPMLVTLPLIMLLLDLWPLRRVSGLQMANDDSENTNPASLARLFLEKAPFFILAAVSSVITYRVQRAGGAMVLSHLPVGERVANALVAYVRYVGKLVWPRDMAVLYPYEHALPRWEVIGAAALLIVASVVALVVVKRRPYVTVGWLWYGLMLVPVIGLVQVGEQSMADRYLYLPATGLFILAVWWLAEGMRRWRWVLGILGTGVLAACLVLTSRQLWYWRNSITLFTHAIEVTKDNAVAECDLGLAYAAEGKTEEARSHYMIALRLRPTYPDVLNDIGSLLAGQDSLEEANAYLVAALDARPNFDSALYNLGSVRLKQGKVEDAIAFFRAAVRSNPRYDKALANLGIALTGLGKLDEAESNFRQAIECAPDNPYAQNGLARVLDMRNKLDEAIAHYEAAVKIKPDFAEAQNYLGAVLTVQRNFTGAEEHLQAALKLRPDFAEAHYNLGNALMGGGKPADAAAQYAEAVRLQPDYMEAHFNLATLMARQKKWDAAAAQYAEVARLRPDSADAQINLADALDHAGKTSEAISAAKKALELAKAAQNRELTAQIQSRLELYQAGKPYPESPSQPQ